MNPFNIDTSNKPLMRAQLVAFSNQVPLLYFILCVNAATLSFAYVNIAPASLAIVVPSILIACCMLRLLIWVRSRGAPLSDKAVVKRLKGTVAIGGVLGIFFLFWALALFSYGDTRAQDQVTFFIGITVISCIFCLMHLRAAALLLTIVIVVPFTLFLISTGDPNLISIAVNLVLVSIAMVYVLVVGSGDFAALVSSQIEAKRLSDENARLANRDFLTGLPNRRHFFSELSKRITQSHIDGAPCVVGVIDLDGFKPVNDRFGHVVGDHLLAETGERLHAFSSQNTLIARLGGDEFGIILGDGRSEADLLAFGEQVCSALQAPYEIMGVVTNISASVGFAAFPEAGETAESIYEHADYALYHAKGHCRGQSVLFSKAHELELYNNAVTEECLRKADLESEMSLHFQPLYDVSLHRLVGFEALARWDSPTLGSVSPAIFIPIAERTDLINRITQCLLRKALSCATEWPPEMRISFNLSARDIVSHEALLRIITIIEDSPVAATRIDLEVTETAVVVDFEQARRSLFLLKALGVKIALDDFGTGFSSLSHIHHLPLDKIKVDRSFVQDIETEQISYNLIKSVINLCDNLKIDCVIEGMETASQAQILQELGCRTMQGYFFGKPIPQNQALDLMERACPAPAQLLGPEIAGGESRRSA